jgi:hypothetical protein
VPPAVFGSKRITATPARILSAADEKQYNEFNTRGLPDPEVAGFAFWALHIQKLNEQAACGKDRG